MTSAKPISRDLEIEIEHLQQLRPRAGEGVHRWIFQAALHLKHCSEEQAVLVIKRAAAGCGRAVDEREIADAVKGARRPRSGPASPKWPAQNARLVAEAVRGGLAVSNLQALSPVDGERLTTGQILDRLFPGEDVLLCAGAAEARFRTALRAELVNVAAKLQFIVPNPMTSVWGIKRDGGRSQRCLDNTGPRRFLVVESDPKKWTDLSKEEQGRFGGEARYVGAKKDETAAVLWHIAGLAKEAPLVMVVDSGGKSLHGWFYVEHLKEESVLKLFLYAVALGADPATWTRCQFVRMPNGTRDNGKKQEVLYFNPQPLEVK